MLATADYPEQPFRDVRKTSGAGGAPRAASFVNGSAGSQKKKHAQQIRNQNVLEKILKTINDLKSDIGFMNFHQETFHGTRSYERKLSPRSQTVRGVLRTRTILANQDSLA